MIGQRNFFGFADAKPAIVIDELPETQLELTLSGVFTALKESNAGAIIVDDKNQSKHYAVGDSLPGNAVLKSIHKNKVVITRNGIFETLYFADLQKDNDEKATGRAISISPDQAKERRQAIRDRINKLRNKKK
jgi:general secretion pathway protein C